MVLMPPQIKLVKRRWEVALRTALLIKLLLTLNLICLAQAESVPSPAPQSAADNKPLSTDERAELLKLIRSLQERVEKLEATQAASAKVTDASAKAADANAKAAASVPVATTTPASDNAEDPVAATPPVKPAKAQDDDDDKF